MTDIVGLPPFSIAEQLDTLVSDYYGLKDLVFACTDGDPLVRQSAFAWAQHRVQMTIGVSLCKGLPAARVDWCMVLQTRCVSVFSGSTTTVLDTTDPDFAASLILSIGNAGLVLVCGIDEALAQPLPLKLSALGVLLRIAQRYPMVVAEVSTNSLASEPFLEKLRIHAAVLSQSPHGQLSTSNTVYADLMKSLRIKP